MKESVEGKMVCSKNGKSCSQKCSWLFSEKKGDDGDRQSAFWSRRYLGEISSDLRRLTTTHIIILPGKANSKKFHIPSKKEMAKM